MTENEIYKSVASITDFTKETVLNILMQAAARNEIKLTIEEMPRLLNLINVAIEQAYQQSAPNFEKIFKRYIAEVKKKASQ